MSWKVIIDKPARKFIARQNPDQQKRILTAIYKLPAEGDIAPLRGTPGRYRLRVGTYRVLYDLHNDILTVAVIKVDNRGDVYKG